MEVLLSCFFPELVMAIRGDKRERRDPVDGAFLLTDTGALLELELFSLSLELRSMETFRLFVAGFFSRKQSKSIEESHKTRSMHTRTSGRLTTF